MLVPGPTGRGRPFRWKVSRQEAVLGALSEESGVDSGSRLLHWCLGLGHIHAVPALLRGLA